MSGEQDSKEKPTKEFIYTWRIENVNCFWQKNGEELLSPNFKIDWLQTSCNLCLYPKGVPGEETFVSYFVVEKEKKPQIRSSGAKLELYLLAADGSEIHSEVSEGFLSMRKSGMLGYPRFISWERLNEKKSDYVQDEIMTLCCRIWNERATKESKATSKVKAFGRTQIRKMEYTSLMPIKCEESEKHEIGAIRSILQKKPIASFWATLTSDCSYKSLVIDIEAEQNEKIKLITFELALLDERGKKVFWKRTFSRHGETTSENIVLSADFRKKSDQYVTPDMFEEYFLFLRCCLTFTNGDVIQTTEKGDYSTNLNDLITKLMDGCAGEENPRCQTASDALKVMHDEPLFPDVVVKASNISFNVHEMVLCTRSSTFESMVNREKTTIPGTSETQQNSDAAHETQLNTTATGKTPEKSKAMLESRNKAFTETPQSPIDDTEKSEEAIEEMAVVIQVEEDDDTMRRVIYFLYTDVIKDMDWEVAKKLYKAAVKYKIELLKRKCYAFLKKNLAMSNLCDILILTEGTEADELKRLAKDFILQNESEVFSSAEWKAFAKSNASTALEMMISNFKPK